MELLKVFECSPLPLGGIVVPRIVETYDNISDGQTVFLSLDHCDYFNCWLDRGCAPHTAFVVNRPYRVVRNEIPYAWLALVYEDALLLPEGL